MFTFQPKPQEIPIRIHSQASLLYEGLQANELDHFTIRVGQRDIHCIRKDGLTISADAYSEPDLNPPFTTEINLLVMKRSIKDREVDKKITSVSLSESIGVGGLIARLLSKQERKTKREEALILVEDLVSAAYLGFDLSQTL